MATEVAFIECAEESALGKEIPETTNVVIYCVWREKCAPPDGSTEWQSVEDLKTQSQMQKFHMFIGSDIELGYRLCELKQFRPSVYTSRLDPSPFNSLQINVIAAETPSWDVPQQRLPDTPENARRILMANLEKKCKDNLLINPEIRTLKRTSQTAQVRNLAQGVLQSYMKQNPRRQTALPTVDEMTEQVIKTLVVSGLLEPASIPYSPVRPQPGQSPPVRVVDSIKSEALSKYIEKYLQNQYQRAAKEKSARAQLTNLIFGLVTAHRGQGVAIPDAEQLSQPMFNKLKLIGVYNPANLSRPYDDEKIRELAKSSEMQRSVVSADSSVELLIHSPADLRSEVLQDAMVTYFERILNSDLPQGKTEKAAKEQIRTTISNTITSKLSDNPTRASQAPQADELTNVVYATLVKHRVFSSSGVGLKYNRTEIAEVGRKLYQGTLFSDLEEENKDESLPSTKKSEIAERVVAELTSRGREPNLGQLQDSCKKSVIASLSFGGKAPCGDRLILSEAADVIGIVLRKGLLNLPRGCDMARVLENISGYRALVLSTQKTAEEDQA